MPGAVKWQRTFTNRASITCTVELARPRRVAGWTRPTLLTCQRRHQMLPVRLQHPGNEAFCQQGTPTSPAVYWLDVQAQTPGPRGPQFGWKTCTTNWNDDAAGCERPNRTMARLAPLTYPYPGAPAGMAVNIDLAFRLNGVGRRWTTQMVAAAGALYPRRRLQRLEREIGLWLRADRRRRLGLHQCHAGHRHPLVGLVHRLDGDQSAAASCQTDSSSPSGAMCPRARTCPSAIRASA